MKPTERRGQNTRFLLLYAFAVAGGAAAYVPFLTILLPLRVGEIAGTDDVEWISYAAFCGAIAASTSGIVFGWLSDLIQNRKIWVWGGLIFSSALLLVFSLVTTLVALIVFILAWQIALNMMLSPLAAWAGDCVPDYQKGLLGGLLAFAPAIGAVAGAIVTIPGLADAEGRLWIVAAIVSLCIMPVLLVGKPDRFKELEPQGELDEVQPVSDLKSRETVARMWIARLLVQICEAALFAYVLFWFRSVDSNLGDDDTAQIISAVVIMAIPAALAVGRWADRKNRPIGPLALCAAAASFGLAAMALSSAPIWAVLSYAIFGVATSIFLSLHSSQTLRVLPRARHRGRDMGIFNLTNTAPSLIMPWLVVLLVPAFGFQILLAILSVLALLAASILWNIDGARLSSSV